MEISIKNSFYKHFLNILTISVVEKYVNIKNTYV